MPLQRSLYSTYNLPLQHLHLGNSKLQLANDDSKIAPDTREWLAGLIFLYFYFLVVLLLLVESASGTDEHYNSEGADRSK